MGRYFFSGGTMPSHDLLPRVCAPLVAAESWRLNGRHYARTLEDWLVRLDRARPQVQEIFAATYGADHARLWLHRWRLFLLACAELFAYADGEEWGVSHYVFRKPRS
jgi:cyclopropane-fatty-acyl-phospholipid synthase